MNGLTEIAFGLFILLIAVVGLVSRRKQHRAWVAEERRDEGGGWIDKRGGERGTYGSLDAEREAERHSLSRQGRINDLALEIRNYAFEHYPGFHERSDAEIKTFTAFARAQAAQIAGTIDTLKSGRAPEGTSSPVSKDVLTLALKKRMLDFCYENFPAVLDAELELIRQFDAYVEGVAEGVVDEIREG